MTGEEQGQELNVHPFLVRLRRRLGMSHVDKVYQRLAEDFNETLEREKAASVRLQQQEGHWTSADLEHAGANAARMAESMVRQGFEKRLKSRGLIVTPDFWKDE